MLIKFIKDFPHVVVGEDLKNYGGFVSGDIVELPDLLAKALIKNGYAIVVIGDKPWYPRIHMKKFKKIKTLTLKDFV